MGLLSHILLPEHSSALFHYDTERKMFEGKESELSTSKTHGPGVLLVFGTIYEPREVDANPVEGFVMVSERTGARVTYKIVATPYDQNRECADCWLLHPTYESGTEVPECADTRVLVLHDMP